MKDIPDNKTESASMSTSPWSIDSIPAALKIKAQWVRCYLKGEVHASTKLPVRSSKVPQGGPSNIAMQRPLGSLEIPDPVHPHRHFGFCIHEDDPFIAIDVDHLPPQFTFNDLPTTIQRLLKAAPTYVEVSPSGQGLHIWYKTDKSLLAHRKDQDKGTKGFEGSVFLRNQFVTFTGHIFEDYHKLDSIEAEFLESVTLSQARTQIIPSAKNRPSLSTHSDFTFSQVKRALFKIPATLSESPLKNVIERKYQSFEPPITHVDDYLHWQYMAAALHFAADYLGMVEEGANVFEEWSHSAETKVPAEGEARQKYFDNPPKYDGQDLTHLTIFALASAVKPEWPYPRIKSTKDGLVKLDAPEVHNLLNWEALFNFYSIRLRQNEINKLYTVEADPLIKQRYFKGGRPYNSAAELESAILYFGHDTFMQQAKPVHTSAVAKWWVAETTETFNPIKDWIDAAPPLAPNEGSYFQQLWETITLQPHEQHREKLYRSYLKKNLMGVIRAHYYTGQYSDTTGIVILQGPEKTYKSTWIRQLLPPALSEYVVSSQSLIGRVSSLQNLQIEAGQCQIWARDEVEAFFEPKTGSILKAFLAQSEDFYRPLYAKEAIQVPRKCIFFGSTNKAELSISDEGSRRIQIIPIKMCDTSAQQKIPMVKVYQELLEELRQTPLKDQPSLWTLSDEEQKLNDQINQAERKAEQTGDMLLKEVYDFESPFNVEDYLTSRGIIDYSKLAKLKDIAFIIRSETGEHISPAALKHSLARVCGAWTDSISSYPQYGVWTIESGKAIYRRHNGYAAKQGYILPLRRHSFKPQQEEEQWK